MMHNIPILIPARGGSKRIPRKNIIDFCGRPLISYAIEESLKVSNDVYVSTEDEEIANVAKQYGAKIINRPIEFAQDNSTSEDVAKHFLGEINYDGMFVLVQATSPLIKSEYIVKAIEKRQRRDTDVISIEKIKGIVYDRECCEYIKTNSEKVNGAIFVSHSNRIFRCYKFINSLNTVIEMPKKHSIDIDTFEDLEIAEYIYKGEKEKGLR